MQSRSLWPHAGWQVTLVRNQRNTHTSVRSLGIAAGLTVLALLLYPARPVI